MCYSLLAVASSEKWCGGHLGITHNQVLFYSRNGKMIEPVVDEVHAIHGVRLIIMVNALRLLSQGEVAIDIGEEGMQVSTELLEIVCDEQMVLTQAPQDNLANQVPCLCLDVDMQDRRWLARLVHVVH